MVNTVCRNATACQLLVVRSSQTAKLQRYGASHSMVRRYNKEAAGRRAKATRQIQKSCALLRGGVVKDEVSQAVNAATDGELEQCARLPQSRPSLAVWHPAAAPSSHPPKRACTYRRVQSSDEVMPNTRWPVCRLSHLSEATCSKLSASFPVVRVAVHVMDEPIRATTTSERIVAHCVFCA